MPDRDKNRGSLVDASGETLAVIDPIPYVVELVKENQQADDIWKRWLNTNFEYLIGLTRLVSVEDWHEIDTTDEPAFENSWTNKVGASAFYLDPFGRVHVRGMLELGTINTTMFTLPTGYRPDQIMYFPSMESTTSSVRLRILTTGEVQTEGASINTAQDITASFRI